MVATMMEIILMAMAHLVWLWANWWECWDRWWASRMRVHGNLLSFEPFLVPSNNFKPWANKVWPPSHHSQWKDPRLCLTFSLQVNVTAASSTITQYIMIYPHSSAYFPPPIFNFSFVDSTDDFLHFLLACINSPLLTFCNKCRLINIYLTSTLWADWDMGLQRTRCKHPLTA